MKTLRAAWGCWLIAAMLFFSGLPGAGTLILLAVIAGFVLSAMVMLSALTTGLSNKHGRQ